MLNDEALVNRLKSEDQEFKKWDELHSQLEARLHSFARLRHLTSEEELEKKRLQKQKLMAKDNMQVILNRHKCLS